MPFTPNSQYVTNQATRIIVKAAGELSTETLGDATADLDFDDVSDVNETQKVDVISEELKENVDIAAYKPQILEDRSWTVSELDLGLFPSVIVSYKF